MNKRRKYVDVVCNSCGITFKRQAREAKRRSIEGHKAYCSRRCAVLIHRKNLGKYLGVGQPENLVNARRVCDEFTPYRRFLRSVQKRNVENGREYNIDLQYLKDLWNEQQGICPLTGWKLTMPKTYKSIEYPSNASLDRIDSNIGYMRGNVRYIALIANYCKHRFTDDQLVEFCKAVSDKHL